MAENKTPAQSMALVRDGLTKRMKTLEQILPKYLSAERFFRLALTQMQKTPKLLQCSQSSLIGAVIEAAQCGLELDGRNAHLIPYKGVATFVPDYKGLVQLGWRSDKIRGIHPGIVYAKDEYEVQRGLHPILKHIPHNGKDRGEVVAYYIVIHTTNEGVIWDAMWKWEVDEHRDRYSPAAAQSKRSGWTVNPDAMGLKTVFKKICRWAPMSTEMLRALSRDDEAEAGVDQQLDIIDIDGEEVPEPPAPQSVDDLVPEDKTPTDDSSGVPIVTCLGCGKDYDEEYTKCPECGVEKGKMK